MSKRHAPVSRITVAVVTLAVRMFGCSVPVVSLSTQEWTASGRPSPRIVTIKVNHAQIWVEGERHIITAMFAKDQNSQLIFYAEFDDSDAVGPLRLAPAPSYSFAIPTGVTSVTAYAHCNRDGLWQSAPFAVSHQIGLHTQET